ncbi:hypothetical protein V2O64_12235 [Verrucomicrobiaceae bacterium 227]
MKKKSLMLLSLFAQSSLSAIPLVGVDFDDGTGGNSEVPDDLNTGDLVTVSAGWTFEGVGGISFDANSNAGRTAPPVGKINGVNDSGPTPPAIGSAPPVDGVHSFSITIGSEPVTLTKVSFDFSAATPSANIRWIAFRTSLDANIIYSAVGPARPAVESAVIDLAGAQYDGLTDQTVEFYFYAGGQASGDIDIDSIVVDGESPTDTDADGLADAFEQLIITADPDDGFATLADVLPGDDFDSDLSSNLEEFNRGTNPTKSDTDADGLIDGVETNDGTFDDLATDTGTNPLDSDTDDDGLSDGVETNDGTLDDVATDTGTNPVEIDTDFDGIPDGFEVTSGLNPFVNDAGADPDSDDSTNLEEFLAGTMWNNPDTDDDGYRDGVESNDGTFDDIDADTGTDPLNPDSDGDGLKDGVETNSGVFNSANDTGSSPLNSNTDSDNFRDGAEVIYHGTDPSNAASFPAVNFKILFMDADGSGTFGADEVAVKLLEDKFGLDKVTVAQASTILPGDETAYDLLVTSSTPSSGDIRGKFIDSAVPIVNWEEAVIDNGIGEFGATSAIHAKSNQTTQVILADHPIRGNLPETVNLYDGAIGAISCTGSTFAGVTVVGTAADGTATAGAAAEIGNEVAGYGMIFAIETGDSVDPGSGTAGGVAPARRVMLPWDDNTLGLLSDDGLTLFSNSLDWALGVLGSPTGLQIVDLSVDSVSNPGSHVVSIEFTSSVGQSYTLLSSTDLSVLAAGGGETVNSWVGAEGTTTATITYPNASFDPKRFFTVRKGGE